MPNPLRNVIPINRIDQKKCKHCGKPVHRNTDPNNYYLGDWIHTADGIRKYHCWGCDSDSVHMTFAGVEREENLFTPTVPTIQNVPPQPFQPLTVTVLPVSVANLVMQNKKRKFRF